jgi:hypothetical protein
MIIRLLTVFTFSLLLFGCEKVNINPLETEEVVEETGSGTIDLEVRHNEDRYFISGLWAYFPFNSNTTEIVKGLTTVVKSISYDTDRFGNINGALETNRFIDMVVFESNELTFDGSFTVSFWMMQGNAQLHNMLGNETDIISKWSRDRLLNREYSIAINRNGNVIGRLRNSSKSIILIGSARLVSWNWNHVAMTFNQTEGVAKLYLDGQEVSSEDITEVSNNNTVLRIGGGIDGNTAFNGYLDDLMFVNGALSQSAIANIASYSR